MSASFLSRGLAALCSPMAIVLLILFFVPWVDLNCSGRPVGSASGFQLATGGMTLRQELQEQNQDEAKKDEGPEARPWFLLGLFVPLALLAVCCLIFLGMLPSISGGTLLALLALVGVIVMILAANVDYREEMRRGSAERDKPSGIDPPDLSGMISTTTRGAVWGCLTLYVVTGLLGVACAALPRALEHTPPEPRREALYGEQRGRMAKGNTRNVK